MYSAANLLCRLCRTSSGPFVDVFYPKGTRGLIVWKVLKDLIQLDVCKEDGLPSTICNGCMDKVVDFRNFKAMCIHSRIEFLKASATVGLIEAESEQSVDQMTQGGMVTTCTSVDSTCAVTEPSWGNSCQDPLDNGFTEQGYSCVSGSESSFSEGRSDANQASNVMCITAPIQHDEGFSATRQPLQAAETTMDQSDKLPTKPVLSDCPRDPLGRGDVVSSQYLERRLDECIGSLKSCDAPNCRKVFSTYKALVIHKRAKHPDIDEKARCLSPGNIAAEPSPGGKDGHAVPNNVVYSSGMDAGGGIRIAEFSCTHPSCGMTFTNLSSLLSHQSAHPPTDDRRPEKHAVVEESDISEVGIVDERRGGNSGSNSVVFCSADENLTDSDNAERSDANAGGERLAEYSTVRSPVQLSSDDSTPGEPEFLCHWDGCGMGFHTFDKLCNHRKRKHAPEKGYTKHDGGSRKRSSSRVSGTDPKVPKLGQVENGEPRKAKECGTTSRASKDSAETVKETPVPSTGTVELPTSYLCAWPNCLRIFVSSKALHEHQAQFEHGRRSQGMLSKDGASRRKPSESPGISGNVVSTSRAKNKEKRKSKVKEEPLENENDEEWDADAFECEFPGCMRLFVTFSALATHYSEAHSNSDTSQKSKKRKVGGGSRSRSRL